MWVTHCMRIGPLIMLGLLALKAHWLVDVLTGSASRGAVAAMTSTSAAVSAPGASTIGAEVVSQVFLWFFVLVVLALLAGLVSLLVGEIKLRRELRRGAAWRRTERARARDTSPWYR
jgi:MFS superfamily sulfate permease-like transporter